MPTNPHWSTAERDLQPPKTDGQVGGVDPQKYSGAGCAVLRRFTLVCCIRRPGMEVWLEGTCLQENIGAENSVSKLSGMLTLCWFLQVSLCLDWGSKGGKWCLPTEVSPWSMPPSTCSEITKHISLLYTPGTFQTAASMLYLSKAVSCAVSLRVGTLFPFTLWAHPELSPLIFKLPGVKPH